MECNKNISTYKQSLKEKILEKAMKAFANRGIKAVRMDDIAQMMGISKRTLYELYENKEVLLYEGVKWYKSMKEQEMQELTAKCSNVMDILLIVYKNKVIEFRQVNHNFYVDISKYPMVKRLLEEDKKNHHQRSLAFIKRGVEEGYFRPDVDYILCVRMFDALSQYIMTAELYRQYSFEHILNNLIFVTLRGVCTQKGMEVLDQFLKEHNNWTES